MFLQICLTHVKKDGRRRAKNRTIDWARDILRRNPYHDLMKLFQDKKFLIIAVNHMMINTTKKPIP